MHTRKQIITYMATLYLNIHIKNCTLYDVADVHRNYVIK